MLKSKLEKFVLKRVLMIFAILTIIDVVFIERKWLVLIGLILGGVFSILRLGFMSRLVKTVTSSYIQSNLIAKGVTNFAVSFAITAIAMVVLVKVSEWIFWGFAAGILLVPFIVMVNGLTEGLGITKNNFE